MVRLLQYDSSRLQTMNLLLQIIKTGGITFG